ncbi:MAG: biotin/lipoyl-binding protein [Rhodobacteraceae bacterium]|nr:biotin/lipoyl-binding protein [Paracoccaceae bacterium]
MTQPIRSVLVANRGEIALRVFRTCRRLGIETIALYTDLDVSAPHVKAADRAIRMSSYLDIDEVVAAAVEADADAVHPGYGFLSENAGFAAAVEAAGLVFIGPGPDAIARMGSKIEAKAAAEAAGVPVLPGYRGEGQSDARLLEEAKALGTPFLVKASAGGGGRGMRLVTDLGDAPEAIASARAEAKGAFGDPAVFLERYAPRVRHVEVQVLGDTHGTVLHLGDRDCSLQRNHQKLIEEAPAADLPEAVRDDMRAAAVRLAQAIGYRSAGTVEYLYDLARGEYYFLEMNTRLQVEHPVTEAITGIDLVEWQLRVASGEPLPAAQADLTITGHAFEARLYAEDVPAGFLPATGTLTHLHFPEGARADTGVRPGDTISPWYDPMIAKIITRGATRAIALSRLRAALEDTEVAGSVTNLSFLAALSRHEGFARGEVDTGLIGRDIDALTAAAAPDLAVQALAALGAAGLADGGGALTGFALWSPLLRTVALDGLTAGVEVLAPGHARVTIDGAVADCRLIAGGWWVNGRPSGARIVLTPGRVSVFGPGAFHFDLTDPLDRATQAAGGGLTLSPMPGLVKAVFVTAGQAVAAGDRLAVLEAMKMEHTLTAARDGTVAEVLAEAGSQVEAGVALIRLEEEE